MIVTLSFDLYYSYKYWGFFNIRKRLPFFLCGFAASKVLGMFGFWYKFDGDMCEDVAWLHRKELLAIDSSLSKYAKAANISPSFLPNSPETTETDTTPNKDGPEFYGHFTEAGEGTMPGASEPTQVSSIEDEDPWAQTEDPMPNIKQDQRSSYV
jgi:hypothetical protein